MKKLVIVLLIVILFTNCSTARLNQTVNLTVEINKEIIETFGEGSYIIK